jgi:protein SCO1/2
MPVRADRARPAAAPRRRFVLGALAMLGAPAVRAHKAAPAPIAGFELPQPLALADFRLAQASGRAFTRASLEGHWTMLLFGFTACPDVCPTTLAQMAEVRRASASSHGPALDGVFVTIDPARDTPARLGDYVARFDRRFTGVTGDERAIRAFAQQFRVRYEPVAGMPYRFDHTASVSVIGPDAKLHAIFTLPLDPARVAGDIARLDRARRNAS